MPGVPCDASRQYHNTPVAQMSASAERVCDGHQSRRQWMLALVDRGPSGDGDGAPAVPAVYRGTEGRPGPVLFTLDIDGERFAIRQAGDGGTAYDWLSVNIQPPALASNRC
jgi:hypothetical protein